MSDRLGVPDAGRLMWGEQPWLASKATRQKSWQGFEEVTVWYSEVILNIAS
jgi:hypothetical protein